MKRTICGDYLDPHKRMEMSEEKYDLIKELEKAENEEDPTVWDDENTWVGYSFCKNNKESQVWWVDNFDSYGEFIFSFDKKKVYYLFGDYPDALTKEEKEIFDKSEPYWANFFKGRKKVKREDGNE